MNTTLILCVMLGFSLLTMIGASKWLFRESKRQRERAETATAKLARAENSRTQIIEELAHDLRTPLTSILTVFECIQDSQDPEYMRQCVGLALPEIAYVNHLINDLFLLAQVQEPAYKPKREVADFRRIIQDEMEQVAAMNASSGKARLELVGDAGPHGLVLLDTFLVRRLVKNLLNNAAKFATTKITVKVERLGEQGQRLSVIDDGPGFPSDSDPFGDRRPDLRGKNAASSSLGLGSVIVRKIVHLHGGYLRTFNRLTASGKTKGAVVEVTLACPPAMERTPAA